MYCCCCSCCWFIQCDNWSGFVRPLIISELLIRRNCANAERFSTEVQIKIKNEKIRNKIYWFRLFLERVNQNYFKWLWKWRCNNFLYLFEITEPWLNPTVKFGFFLLLWRLADLKSILIASGRLMFLLSEIHRSN